VNAAASRAIVRISAGLLAAGISASANAASFTPLGFFPVEDPANVAYGSSGAAISADGAVVVGSSLVDVPGYPSFTRERAFRWTAATGMVNLGTPSLSDPVFEFSRAEAVSADGGTVVGTATIPVGATGYDSGPFRWTQAQGLAPVFTYGYTGFGATGVSADGSVVAGTSLSPIPDTGTVAWRYTAQTGPVGLGFFSDAGFPSSRTGAISADGTVIVGGSSRASGSEAFRWTAGAGLVGLGDLAGGEFFSESLAVSADGATVVGFGSTAAGREAMRWTATSGMIGLGTLAGYTQSQASGVSSDGTVIVGTADSVDGAEAFLWTQAGGMQSLFDYLVAQGATGLDGWSLDRAAGISPDGQWIVGSGRGPNGVPQAFRAHLSTVPAPGALWLLGTGVAALGGRRLRGDGAGLRAAVHNQAAVATRGRHDQRGLQTTPMT